MRERVRVIVAVARDPGLARIELAFLGFKMAESATWIAVLVYAYRLGGAGTAGLFAVAQLVPSAIVAPFAAFAGDRFRRDRVLLSGYLWQAVALALTASAMLSGAPVPLTLLAATGVAVGFTLTRPIQAAILPNITHSLEDLAAANAVSSLMVNVGMAAGPFLAGLLLTRLEPGDVFAVFAVVSCVGLLLVTRLGIDPVDLTPRVRMRAGDVLAESLGGFAALGRHRPVLLLVVVLSATIAVVGALDVLFVAVAIDLLHQGAGWAGFLGSAFGLGGIAGAVAAVSLVGRRRLTPSLAGGGLLYGTPIVGIGLVPIVISAPILLAVAGLGSSVASVAGSTLLQRVAPEAVVARVFGILEGLGMLALALGSVGSAQLIARFGIAVALVATGLFVPTTLALAWFALRALDREARAPDPGALALIRRLPFFAPLSAPATERIMASLVRLEAQPGEVLVREGEPGDRFYVIVSGSVRVTQHGRELRIMSDGDHFGEIALLREVPRTATVTALAPCRLLALERDPFLEAITGHPRSHEHAHAMATATLDRDAATTRHD